jgi:hypothetical protein
LSYLEDSRQAGKSSSPQNLASPYYIKNELGSTIGSETSLSSHPTLRGIWRVLIGGEEDIHHKLEVVWSTWTAGRLTFSAFTDFGHH